MCGGGTACKRFMAGKRILDVSAAALARKNTCSWIPHATLPYVSLSGRAMIRGGAALCVDLLRQIYVLPGAKDRDRPPGSRAHTERPRG